MGKLSREKGKRGEREVVQLLKDHGFSARRGQQFKGTKDSPDVLHNLDGLYIEVKYREQVSFYAALEKARKEAASTEAPVLFSRKKNKTWLVTMDADDFLDLMEYPDYG